MSDALHDFLAPLGWAEAQSAALAGDASARRYARLQREADTAILMIAPQAAEEMARFERIDRWLRGNGFSAPEILGCDAQAGYMLLEDLGDDLVARLLRAGPAREPEFYAQITEFLVALGRAAPPDGLTELAPPVLGEMTDLLASWYLPALGVEAEGFAATLAAELNRCFAAFDDGRRVTCLRDFHAENLLWCPTRQGVARFGVLDFQDAVLAHPAYDLVSALQDARRDVAAEVEARECARFIALSGADPLRFTALYALLGVQRGLRIMGIFTRLAQRDGKTHYLALMPRVWRGIRRNLAHPELAGLAKLVLGTVPPPPEHFPDPVPDHA